MLALLLVSCSLASNKLLPLDGTWLLTGPHNTKILAPVPGEATTALLAQGLIEDPYWRDNDVVQRWVGLGPWTYSREFDFNEQASAVEIVFEGLDTVATITLNGVLVAHTANMFRKFTFDITDKIVANSKNNITVQFANVVETAKDTFNAYPYPVPFSDAPEFHGEPYRNFVRKSQCHFSWDWGPCMLPSGIWKPVYLRVYQDSHAMLEAVTAHSELEGGSSEDFVLTIDAWIRCKGGDAKGELIASLMGFPEKRIRIEDLKPGNDHHATISMRIPSPDLWWPHGYGEQPLYALTVTWQDDGGARTSEHRSIGFRTVELVREPVKGQEGETFYFRVNGVPVFVKGANWIPADSFESRVTNKVLRNLLLDVVDANMNTVRVWGGGIYEHDDFYAIADELGILVWEEIMFACAMYPRNEAFLENVVLEVKDQIMRLKSHPSLMLWSSNNENEAGLHWYPETRDNPPLYVTDYSELYVNTVQKTIKEMDPHRPFWPSSPSNGPVSEAPYVQRFGNANSENWGDVHYYNYQAVCNDVTTFLKPRFASEYGWQSFPWAIKDATEPADWSSPSSPMMLHRQHHPNGTAEIIAMMANFLPVPRDGAPIDHFLYLSQALQVICIRSETEHYRRGRFEPHGTMGTIYWQLNDIWQGPSWASVEYGGEWKLLHSHLSEVFDPTLSLTVHEVAGEMEVWVLTDGGVEALTGSVAAELWSWDSSDVKATVPLGDFKLDAFGGKQVFKGATDTILSKGKCTRKTCAIRIVASASLPRRPGTIGIDSRLSDFTVSTDFYPSSLGDVSLKAHKTRVVSVDMIDNSTATVTIQAQALAPWLMLRAPKIAGHFVPNGFMALPLRDMTVKFEGREAFTEKELTDALTMMSVSDTINS